MLSLMAYTEECFSKSLTMNILNTRPNETQNMLFDNDHFIIGNADFALIQIFLVEMYYNVFIIIYNLTQ